MIKNKLNSVGKKIETQIEPFSCKKKQRGKVYITIFALFLVFFSINLVSAAWTSNLNDDLVTYLDFNEGSGSRANNSVDSNTFYGTLQNSAVFNTTGLLGGSLELERTTSDWVSLSSGVPYGNNFTISIWIRAEDLSLAYYRIFSSTTPTTWSHFNTGSNRLDWTLDSAPELNTAVTLNQFTTGQWKHLVYQYNGTHISLWIDGVFKGDTAETGNVTPSDFAIGAAVGGTSTFDGGMDEFGFWKRELTAAEISQLYNSGNGIAYIKETSVTTTLNSPANNTNNASSVVRFTASAETIYLDLKNATIQIYNSTGDLINKTTNTMNELVSNTTNFDVGNLNYGINTWNVYACAENATDTLCDWADDNYTINYGYVIDGEDYEGAVTETQSQAFNINISVLSSILSVSGQLIYNGTPYVGNVKSLAGNQYKLNYSLIAPDIPAGAESVEFYWNITIYDGTTYFNFNSTNHSQTINPIGLINVTYKACASGYFEAINYTFQNAANFTQLSPDVKFNFKYGVGNTSSETYFGEYNNISVLRVCVNETQSNLKLGYGEIDYQEAGYVNRRYYMFEDHSLSNSTTEEYILYDLVNGDSTSFIFEVKNTFLNPYTNKYIGLLRWYPQNNTYRTVEMAVTDNDGKTVMKVKTEDVDYRLGVYETDGTLIKLADPVRMACLINPCTYTLRIVQEELDVSEIYDIETSLTFDNSNDRFVFIWNDPSQNTDSMRLVVLKDLGFQETVICNSTSSGYTGVLTCSIGNETGMFIARAYRTASPEIAISSLVKQVRTVWNNTIGLFVSMIIMLVAALVGIFSPIGAVIMMILGLIPALILGSITFPIFMGIGVLGGIIIHMMKSSR